MWNARATRTLVLAFTLVASGAAAAQAHEEVAVGHLQLVVGFGEEPAYTGLPNSVSILISHDGQPVTDARGLEVEVSFGDASVVLPLETFGDTGDYRASFVPSQPGDYTFHVRGRVEGERINEEFTSGPSTFSAVEDPSSAAFPPVDTPSNDELAARIETESSRTAEVVSAVENTVEAARLASADARSTAMIGIVVGGVGVIAAIGALAMARRR